MTSPFDAWFSLSIRRERRSFIYASLLLIALLLVVFVGISALDISSRVKALIFLIYAAMAVYVSYTLSAQRLRDMGVTGWLALIWIPISFASDELKSLATSVFLLVLSVVPGTDGANRYGDSPIRSDSGEINHH